MALCIFPRNRIQFCIFWRKQNFFKHSHIFCGIFWNPTLENNTDPHTSSRCRSSSAVKMSKIVSPGIIEIGTFCMHHFTRININYHFSLKNRPKNKWISHFSNFTKKTWFFVEIVIFLKTSKNRFFWLQSSKKIFKNAFSSEILIFLKTTIFQLQNGIFTLAVLPVVPEILCSKSKVYTFIKVRWIT